MFCVQCRPDWKLEKCIALMLQVSHRNWSNQVKKVAVDKILNRQCVYSMVLFQGHVNKLSDDQTCITLLLTILRHDVTRVVQVCTRRLVS